MADGQVLIEIQADNRGAKQTIKETTQDLTSASQQWENSGDKMAGIFKKIAGAISAAKIGQWLVNFGKDAVEAASNLEEVQNVVDATFGPGAAEVLAPEEGFLHGFNVLPPAGLDAVAAKPSLYSSSPAMIRRIAELDDRELAKFVAAREAWRRDRVPLNKTLDIALYRKLTEKIPSEESGLYRIEIGRADGPAGAAISAVLVPRPGTRFLEFYEFVRY